MGTLDDNDLPSVRVAIDGASESPIEPESDADTSGASRWVIAAGAALLVAVLVVVLSLRPDGDAAADGSQRQAPESTVPVEQAEPTDDEAPSPEDGQLADLPPLPEGTLRPIELNLPDRVLDIVPASPGFLALSSVNSTTPPLLRSVDGVDWFRVGTTANTQGEPNERSLEWVNLIAQGSGFGVLGYTETGGFLPISEVFVSNDGAGWDQVDGIGSLSNIPQPGLVISYDNTSVFSLGLDTSALGRFVDEQTNLVVPENDRICEFRSNGSFDVTGNIFLTCNGQELEFSESNLVSAGPADEVLTCLNLLADVSGFGPWAVSREVFAAPTEPEVIDLLQPNDFPALLSNNRLALIDIGSQVPEGFGRCDGIIDAFTQRDSAVVILGPDSEVVRSPFSEVSSRRPQVLEPRIAGEVTFDSGRSFLIIWLDGDLRAIDIETGEWSGPLLDPGFGFSSNRFTISNAVLGSGNRVYIMGGDELLSIGLIESGAGSLQTMATLSPIARENVPELDFIEILYADDDQLFYRDNEEHWVIDVSAIVTN